jgi:hypothetical protein
MRPQIDSHWSSPRRAGILSAPTRSSVDECGCGVRKSQPCAKNTAASSTCTTQSTEFMTILRSYLSSNGYESDRHEIFARPRAARSYSILRAASWTCGGGRCGRRGCAVERERTPHSLLVHACGKESPQTSDHLCLLPNQVSQPRIAAGNDLEQRFSHRLGAGPLLFITTYCSESSLPP